MTKGSSSRRLFLAGALAAGGLGGLPRNVFAAGPHRFVHGAAEVFVLSDGYFPLPAEVIAPEASPEQWTTIAARLGGAGRTIDVPVNVPVIRIGRELIVIDVGGGGRFQPTEGALFANFRAARLDPAAVTRVLLTHAHPDHLWGLSAPDGSLRFPNATYYISPVEWDFWMSPDFARTMPEVLHPFARGAQRDLSAIKDRVVMLRPGQEVVTGLQAVDTSGHTPGHLAFEFAGREALLFAGDAITNPVTSFEHPHWRFGNDTDPDAAIRTRSALLSRLARQSSLLLAAHLPYPGIGRVERNGAAFRLQAA